MKVQFRGKTELVAQIYCVLAATVFLISGLAYLCLGYVPMTHQDFWRIYDILLNHSWLEGALLKFNGHSLFFPSLIWLIDLRFFHGSQQLLFSVGMVLLAITTALLLSAVWRDQTTGPTAKFAATLLLIVGNFWMGRASMIESGAFNCCYSLALGGSVFAVLCLPAMRKGSLHYRWATLVVLLAGLVSSCSFGAGLVVWPMLVFIGWCLRLPLRSVAVLVTATIIVGVIYALLPPHVAHQPLVDTTDWFASDWRTALSHLCRLVGSPVYYAAVAWRGSPGGSQGPQSYNLALCGGAAGMVLAVFAGAGPVWRRDLSKSTLQTTGLALVTFNLLVLMMVVLSRNQHFRLIPNEVVAPRYVFWSSLFWAGLLLLLIAAAEQWPRVRWACFLFVFVIPIVAWPEHCQEGFHWRYARLSAEVDAASLLNGVTDPKRALFPDPKQVALLTPQLRARRLDIFAGGVQDWIGQPISTLFHGQEDKGDFRGHAIIRKLAEGATPPSAVRVTGTVLKKIKAISVTMVIVDSHGVVAGIARSRRTSDFLNRLLYKGRMPARQFAGYIPRYEPATKYVIRAVRKHGLSKTFIEVAALPP
jgi:hypothetical protein